ncbi:MAG: dTDP-glucose 4,6-dehydratase [Magnetococcales bacterium]|nr:dTDP-glucose 4,6-dehydratase [Magnetococcales bacterium]
MTIFTPQSALITGGAGFIGSHFVRLWLAMLPNVRIVTLDKLTYSGSLERLDHLPDPSRHTFIHGDVGDAALVRRILYEHQVDTIVHFAAEIHVDRSISGPAPFIQSNIVGTFTLLDAAREFWLRGHHREPTGCRYHQISTDEVFGALGNEDRPFTEASPYHPNSPYSASKAAADHLAWAYHHTYGLPVTFSHCSNNYGPAQQKEAFIPTVIRACVQQRPIPLYGDGGNRRDWLFVEDHCHGIDRVIRRGRPGERYLFGGGGDPTNLEVARQICAIMDRLRPVGTPHAGLIARVPDRPGHDWRYAVDDAKARAELDWQPGIPFVAGLETTVGWYLENSTL